MAELFHEWYGFALDRARGKRLVHHSPNERGMYGNDFTPVQSYDLHLVNEQGKIIGNFDRLIYEAIADYERERLKWVAEEEKRQQALGHAGG